MKRTLLIAVMCLTGIVQAREVKVLDITNQENNYVTELMLQLDKNGDVEGFYKDSLLNGKMTGRKAFSSDQIREKEGIVLDQSGSYVVVRMLSENFADHNGGNITLDTLYSGINGARKRYGLELVRSKDGWDVEYNGRAISKMHLISHKLLFKTIGIKTIQVWYKTP